MPVDGRSLEANAASADGGASPATDTQAKFTSSEGPAVPRPARAPKPETFDEKTSVDEAPAWRDDEPSAEDEPTPAGAPTATTHATSARARVGGRTSDEESQGSPAVAIPPPRKKRAFVPTPRRRLLRAGSGKALQGSADDNEATQPALPAPPQRQPNPKARVAAPREERVVVDDLLALADDTAALAPALDEPLIDPIAPPPQPAPPVDAFPDHDFHNESDATGVISNISVPVEVPRKRSPAMWLAVAAASTAAGVALAMMVSANADQAKAKLVDEVAEQEPADALETEPTPVVEDEAETPTPPAESGTDDGERQPTTETKGSAEENTAAPAEPVDESAPAGGDPNRRYTQEQVAAYKRWVASQSKKQATKSPFDRGAAVSALQAAAGRASACKQAGGPVGSGRVELTFQPSGRATSARIVSGDFLGNAVGGCVARTFRSARVPAFSGDAVTVVKTFYVR